MSDEGVVDSADDGLPGAGGHDAGAQQRQLGRELNGLSAASYCAETQDVNYTEGLFIDYRHFDKEDIEPIYPFGYGGFLIPL